MNPTTYESRALGAFLGLACGDAYGRTLEFMSGPAVRTAPVDTDHLTWTDDTHMALYLSEAVLAMGAGPLDDDTFGALTGDAFTRWLDDASTYGRAPGSTCLAGARRYLAHGDWKESGVPGGDTCGAVMRIVPIGIALRGNEALGAARVQALVTHSSAAAVSASVAAVRLLRLALLGRFARGPVLRVAWGTSGLMREALIAAVHASDMATRNGWLDESAIPPGDGGWKAVSALGLAVYAALGWGQYGPGYEVAVDKAARIDGDSDTVAGLTGMFLGAANGVRAIRPSWLAGLEARDRIEEVARALAAQYQGRYTPGA